MTQLKANCFIFKVKDQNTLLQVVSLLSKRYITIRIRLFLEFKKCKNSLDCMASVIWWQFGVIQGWFLKRSSQLMIGYYYRNKMSVLFISFKPEVYT